MPVFTNEFLSTPEFLQIKADDGRIFRFTNLLLEEVCHGAVGPSSKVKVFFNYHSYLTQRAEAAAVAATDDNAIIVVDSDRISPSSRTLVKPEPKRHLDWAVPSDDMRRKAKSEAELEAMIGERLLIGGAYVSVRADRVLGWTAMVITAPKHACHAQARTG